jgi:hypothetical protein
MKNTWTYRLISCLIFLSLFIQPNFAQEDKNDAFFEGRGYFIMGAHFLDLGNLNVMLENKGYNAYFENFISIGGGGYWRINRFIMEGEGHTILESKEKFNIYKSSISGGFGFFNIGYVLISKPHFSLYPLFGPGYGGLTLKIWDENDVPTFGEILDNPKRTVETSTGNFLINLGIGLDILTPFKKDETGEGGPCFGFRMGYLLAIGKGDWSYEGNDISGGPEIGLDGFYIRLFIGAGGRSYLTKE